MKEDLSGYCGLNGEVFKVETDLSKVMAKDGGSGNAPAAPEKKP